MFKLLALLLRNSSLNKNGFFSCHYLGAPALSWDTILNMAKFWVELISDADMYLFFEKDMRGIVSYIFKRYCKANKKYLKSSDPTRGWKHIIYLDSNSFDDFATSRFCSTSELIWIDPKECDMSEWTCNSSSGCVSKIDLENPKELGKLHIDYPFTPDKLEIKKEMLSKCQLWMSDFYNILIGNAKKLVPKFLDKEKWVIQYENLQT